MNNAVLLTLCLLPLRRAFQLKNLGTLRVLLEARQPSHRSGLRWLGDARSLCQSARHFLVDLKRGQGRRAAAFRSRGNRNSELQSGPILACNPGEQQCAEPYF